MEEVNLSLEVSENDIIEEIKQIYCFDDFFNNKLDQLNSYLNKLVQKLDIKISNKPNSEKSSTLEKIKKVAEKSKGSLELQKLLPKLTTSMCDMIFQLVSFNFNYNSARK
jgi:hypothetical protein